MPTLGKNFLDVILEVERANLILYPPLNETSGLIADNAELIADIERTLAGL